MGKITRRARFNNGLIEVVVKPKVELLSKYVFLFLLIIFTNVTSFFILEPNEMQHKRYHISMFYV